MTTIATASKLEQDWERQTQRRRDRYRLRSVIQRVGDRLAAEDRSWSSLPIAGVCKCGRVPLEMPAIRRKGGRAYLAGVASCSSVWLCPMCEAKIRTGRAVELRELATRHADAGGLVFLMTLTVRHNATHSLYELVDLVLDTWKSLQDDDRWRAMRRTEVIGPRGGRKWIDTGNEPIIGFSRALEVTQGFTAGEMGDGYGSWHPHLHIVLYGRPGADPDEVMSDCEWIGEAWAQRAENRGGASVRPNEHGFDIRQIPIDDVQYISKISDEITRSDLKGRSRSVWALVDRADTGDEDALRLFLEYAGAMKGRKALQFSHGLRRRYGMQAKSDEQIVLAVDAEIERGEHVQHINREDLAWWMRPQSGGRPPRIVGLLELLDGQTPIISEATCCSDVISGQPPPSRGSPQKLVDGHLTGSGQPSGLEQGDVEPISCTQTELAFGL